METHALPDQFFKSWVLAFLVGAVVVGTLQAIGLLSPEHVLTREAPVWGALVLLCSIDPVLRYFGVLKAEIEQRWGDYTIASVLGRATGALIGGVFAWGFAVLGG
ncbi:hypothetical protein A9R05_23980 [Burkholderia sp. KK1]|uniref:hypothetical protein n=1 Tax=unclassified Caballeronia TaxID=2646786 RepID=UPI000238749C|nr:MULTISPECIES: hypothetical protein [unclassified Caballeronia]AET91889.1 hypothetical protein BYI23_B012820 [Burkholderia sp. YI23]AQH01834.1 hypothetical protein A9R05_23980 [Burkholderia sp. KK1]BBP97830.1 hypothetical protein BSFA1_29590 [Burkholderia sp. SFA1]MCE4545294.1 hypothetical protein [Caballeronia sp. PC1]MCE4570720.1 hypothetical protein [Caballeronia sp. CLC5]